MRMNNAITTLVGEELEKGKDKWIGTLAAPNGSLYGIPFRARRVAKFNPIDKSMTRIGPDFGDAGRGWYRGGWSRGTITDNGIIYCPPPADPRGILKIDTNTDNVTELDRNLLPEQGDHTMWRFCAAALDGCIYFMPYNARRIMKLDPNNNDAMTSVGDDLGDKGGEKYSGTVIGIDGCVYGIPNWARRILKYDPINDTTSFVGEEADEFFRCPGNSAVGRDGCIYAFTGSGQVLRIDTTNNSHFFVGSKIQSIGWSDAILGIDGCIYWPPTCTYARTFKYDPHLNQTSFVGDDFRNEYTSYSGWSSGALASDGVVYCIPVNAKQVLAIDPFGEFLATTKANMQEHPEEFGSLFQTIEADEHEDYDSVPPSLTNFDLAVIKFGQNAVFEVLEKAMKPMNDYCKKSNLYPFMIAASYKEGPVCVINHLLRYDLSWVNSCISGLGGKAPKSKRMRIN